MKWDFLLIHLLASCYIVAALKQVGVILNHDSKIDAGILTQYVNRLTSPKCQFVSEISISLTTQNNPEVSDLQRQSSSSVIPLLFDFKPNADYDAKLSVPKDSTAEVYFIGNYNSQQNCEKIGEYLAFAQTYESAGLIPLVGELQQTSVITFDNSQRVAERIIKYARFDRLNHFQIVQNIRLISRHTLQLAHSNIRQIKLMADHSNICHQIFINFVNAHFYPQLRNKIYKFADKLPTFSQEEAERTNCVNQFIDILGYSPLFYQNKIFNGKLWKNPNFDRVVELKKVALNAQLLSQAQGRRLFVSSQQRQYQFSKKQPQNVPFSMIELTILQILAVILLVLLISTSILHAKIKLLKTQTSSCLNNQRC